MNNCHYCKNSYLPCDELFCSIFDELKEVCNNFELDEYFDEEIKEYRNELQEGKR